MGIVRSDDSRDFMVYSQTSILGLSDHQSLARLENRTSVEIRNARMSVLSDPTLLEGEATAEEDDLYMRRFVSLYSAKEKNMRSLNDEHVQLYGATNLGYIIIADVHIKPDFRDLVFKHSGQAKAIAADAKFHSLMISCLQEEARPTTSKPCVYCAVRVAQLTMSRPKWRRQGVALRSRAEARS